MKLAKGLGEFFGLDIDTNAVRVVQLSRTGTGWSLSHYGYTPVDSKITSGDSPESKRRLGEAIMTAVGQAGIKTSNVAVGLPSNKTFSTIIDVPKVPEQELKGFTSGSRFTAEMKPGTVLYGDGNVIDIYVKSNPSHMGLVISDISLSYTMDRTYQNMYGSWGEYGIIANGNAESASGAGLSSSFNGRSGVNPRDYNKLTFANTPKFGNFSSTSSVPDNFTLPSVGSVKGSVSGNVDVDSLATGEYNAENVTLTGSKFEILLTSTAKFYAEELLELVENLGFNVIAEEPNAIAMVRSLSATDSQDARLIINMGENSTDLAVVYNGAPRLIRMIPTGLSSLVRSAVQNLSVQEDQARQFILKFGLAPDKLDGQVLRAIDSTLDNFSSELVKSIKFFQTRYPSVAVSGILLSGFGSAIPQLDGYVMNKTGVQSITADPWQRVQVSQSDQQQLAPIASEFAIAVGLAQRSNIS